MWREGNGKNVSSDLLTSQIRLKKRGLIFSVNQTTRGVIEGAN